MKKKCFNISGVVTLEYAAIAVMVLLGILVMGPHVVRSINAYFYYMDQEAKESFREEFKYADPDDITVPGGDDCIYSTTHSCSIDYPNQLASFTTANTATCYELLAREGGTSEHLLTDEEVEIYYGWDAGGTPIRYKWDECYSVPSDRRSETTRSDGLGLDDTFSDKPCGFGCCLPAQPRSICECLDSVASISDCPEGRLARLYTQKCGGALEDQNFWKLDDTCNDVCLDEPDEASSSQDTWCSGETIPHIPLDQEEGLPLKFVPWGPYLKFCNEDGSSGDPDNGPEDICDPEKTASETSCDACYAQCAQTFLPYDISGDPAWVGTYCDCAPGWKDVEISGECPAGYTQAASCPNGATEYDLSTVCWYTDFLGGASIEGCE